MQSDARATAEAAALIREHADVLSRLPATVHAFVFVELHKWSTLFPAEQRYQRTLLEHLSGISADDLAKATDGIARVEAQAGIHKLNRRDPARLQDDAQALLRKQRLIGAWRKAIDTFFQQIDPALEARLYPPDAPRRLIVQIYGRGIAVNPNELWRRFKGSGLRLTLKLEGSDATTGFLRKLFGDTTDGDSVLPLFASANQRAGFAALDTWIVESHEGLHELIDGRIKTSYTLNPTPASMAWAPRGVTGLSYERLRPYRDELMKSLYNKILSGVESPQAFAAYARSLTIAPPTDTLLHKSDILQAFIRDVFLTGNGTLFVNNTFVEWAAVQALRRAQPRLLVARYGVRDKLKPFSSLLLFSQPRASDQIPLIEDPVGSFIDVEQLSYYVWLNAEKNAAYRKKTLYLFLAEGIEDVLALRSDADPAGTVPAVSLSDLYSTMADWLNVPRPAGVGRPIPQLVS